MERGVGAVSFEPGAATLDQTLRFLSKLAQSSAYATELASLLADTNPTTAGVSVWQIVDANGARQTIDLADTDYSDLSWVAPKLASVQITDALRIEPPFPRLALVGQPGQLMPGGFRLDQSSDPGVGYVYTVDCIVITANGDPNAAAREAQLHTEALDRLVARNSALGGLVRLVDSAGPSAPATAEWRGKGTVGGGHLRLRVTTIRVL